MMLEMKQKDQKIRDLEQLLEDQCLELTEALKEKSLLMSELIKLGSA